MIIYAADTACLTRSATRVMPQVLGLASSMTHAYANVLCDFAILIFQLCY